MQFFNNYYETRGGGTSFDVYADIGGDYNYIQQDQITDGAGLFITGMKVSDDLPPNRQRQINVTTDWANYVHYSPDKTEFGAFQDPLVAEMAGKDVQHDTMPQYLFTQTLIDLGLDYVS